MARPHLSKLLRCVFPLPVVWLLVVQSWAGEIEWSAVEKEAETLLSHYIQIDTTNPPGNEIAAARFWRDVLAKEGIEAQVFEPSPGRGIVYARLKG